MLLLVHHGDALGPDVDSMRPLSEPGKEASARLAGAVAARGVAADLFWHSGKLRARQTAELFRRACNPQAALSAARGLQPMDPPGLLLDQLLEEKRSLVLVGHMPHLARLLRALCGEPPDTSATGFPLHGCVALERTGDRWKEIWRLDAEP
jgi:phosphohistidine phosphatase